MPDLAGFLQKSQTSLSCPEGVATLHSTKITICKDNYIAY